MEVGVVLRADGILLSLLVGGVEEERTGVLFLGDSEKLLRSDTLEPRASIAMLPPLRLEEIKESTLLADMEWVETERARRGEKEFVRLREAVVGS